VGRSGRPWRYDEIVDALLYDPVLGFYGAGRGRAGRTRGDFLTSPEVGPLYGAVLARVLDGWWVELGRPDPFVVAEAGAGPGTLARAVFVAGPLCGRALRYMAVEVAPAQRAQHPPSVQSADQLPEHCHVIVANELLDNLPFRLAEWDGATWREVLVGVAGEEPGPELHDGRLPPRPPASDRQGAGDRGGHGVGSRVPLLDRAAAWVDDARRRASTVLVVDYGSATEELARRPWTDWVRTYRGHQRGGHPLDDPGQQDVTCEVAFDQLAPPDSRMSQAEALERWGIADLVEEGRRRWVEGAARGDLAALVGRSRVREAEALLDPSGLGAFQVLSWTDLGAGPTPRRPGSSPPGPPPAV
jgi:SAM-dependent MidA family methyltransferase